MSPLEKFRTIRGNTVLFDPAQSNKGISNRTTCVPNRGNIIGHIYKAILYLNKTLLFRHKNREVYSYYQIKRQPIKNMPRSHRQVCWAVVAVDLGFFNLTSARGGFTEFVELFFRFLCTSQIPEALVLRIVLTHN